MKVSRLAVAIVLSTISTAVVDGFFFNSPNNHNSSSNPTGKEIDVEEEEGEPLTMKHLRKQLQLRKDQPVRVEEPSSQTTTAGYNEAMIRMEYKWWLPKHGKEADADRYPRFRANWISLFESGRASGDYFSLNEFGDCTEEEYSNMAVSTSQRQACPCPEYTGSMIQQEYSWWLQNFDKQPSASRYLQFKNNWVQLDAHGRATGEYFPLNENGDRTEEECLEILNQRAAQGVEEATASFFESICQPEVISNPMAAYEAAMGIAQAKAAAALAPSRVAPVDSASVGGRNMEQQKEHHVDPMAAYDAAMAAVRTAAVASAPLTAPTNAATLPSTQKKAADANRQPLNNIPAKLVEVDPMSVYETAMAAAAAAASAPLTRKVAVTNRQPMNAIPGKPVVVDPHATAASASLIPKKAAAKPLNEKILPVNPLIVRGPDLDKTASTPLIPKKATTTKPGPVKTKRTKPLVVMDPYLEDMVQFQCGFY
jgi:hypothetical protein